MVRALGRISPRLGLILLLSAGLRLGAAVYLGDEVVSLPGTADQVSYHALALRVLGGHGFTFGQNWWPATAAGEPTAHWSYLYTAYLAGVYAIFGPHPIAARLIQALIVGLAQPYLAYRLAAQLKSRRPAEASWPWGHETVPLLAAAITAGYLYFVYYAASLMTEAFYITALLATLSLALSLARLPAGQPIARPALALGLALSVAVLLRQLFLLLAPLLFLWLLWAARQRGALRPAAAAVLLASAVLLGSILPLTAYNYSRFGRFVLLNTNAGYAFFWGNHPSYGAEFVPASEMGDSYQALIPADLRGLDEAALDQELLKRGIGFALDEPGRYLALSLSRVPEYFKFWPDPNSSRLSNLSRLGSFAALLPLMLYGLLRPWFSRRPGGEGWRIRPPDAPYLLLYAFSLAYTAIHLLTWAQIRYRLPVDAILVIFAGLAATEALTAAAGWQRGRRPERVREGGGLQEAPRRP